MTYAVKELFYTLQGEGAHAGRPAVFCRFSGCNLWSGREVDRANAICRFCDTDFVGVDGPGGGKFAAAAALAETAASTWPHPNADNRFIVCTGGEPLLQLDDALVAAFHEHGFEIAIETNGTLQPPDGIDWICVSPKAGADLVLRRGHELKLVFPQPDLLPDTLSDCRFDHYYLQPMDGDNTAANTQAAIQYCLDHPKWRLSLQTHKLLGIP